MVAPDMSSAMNEVRHSFRVMTYDIDFAGVVSNITYTRWLEDLRNWFAEPAVETGAAPTGQYSDLTT